MAIATIRDLRNHFPKVKKLVEVDGEVIVTDKGEPKYKLTLYTPAQAKKSTRSKNYMARLSRYQPDSISAAAAKSLHDENRGRR
jgi:antitoxin (DNA-binding transcriptional repressor) of toxin-antitoxin stability system